MQDTITPSIGYGSSSNSDDLNGDDDTITLQLAASGSGWIASLDAFTILQAADVRNL